MKTTMNVSSSLVAIVSSALLLLSSHGCAQMGVDRITKQYEQQFAAAKGKATKDDYIRKLGPPLRCAPVSDGEVCTWRFSYGTRGYTSGSRYGVHASAHEMYDEFILTFDKNGVLTHYSFLVQR